jgi:adenine phosphoribosyltransferase
VEITKEELEIISNSIRDIKDFPKPGIVFKDITTLLNDSKAFSTLMNHLAKRYESYGLDYIAGIDSRGFIFGAALAQMLGVGFVPIRKKGKLPYTTISEKYSLEYGVDEVEVHIDAFHEKEGARVLLIDDLIATGGTATAAANLIKQAKAECVEACFIINLKFLKGEEKLSTKTYSIINLED